MSVFEFLEELVRKTNTTEFSVAEFDGYNLLLTGSSDLSYYHEAEIFFEDVFYIEVYTSSLSYPKLRYATAEEIGNYGHLGFDANSSLFVITSDSHDPNPTYFIGASRINARECMVYHYDRKNLQEGEEVRKQSIKYQQ